MCVVFIVLKLKIDKVVIKSINWLLKIESKKFFKCVGMQSSEELKKLRQGVKEYWKNGKECGEIKEERQLCNYSL